MGGTSVGNYDIFNWDELRQSWTATSGCEVRLICVLLHADGPDGLHSYNVQTRLANACSPFRDDLYFFSFRGRPWLLYALLVPRGSKTLWNGRDGCLVDIPDR